MPTTFRCPECDTPLNVPEEQIGKKVRCGRCKTVSLAEVPEEDEREERRDDEEDREERPGRKSSRVSRREDDDDEREERPRREERAEPRRRKRQRNSAASPSLVKIFAWIGGVVAFIVFGVGGFLVVRVILKPPVIPYSDDKWKPFEVNGCRVLMPGTPTQRTQSDGGFSMIMYILEPDPRSVFGIAYSEGTLPAHRRNLPKEQLLNDALDGSLAASQGKGAKEVRRGNIQAGPHTGKEMVMSFPAEKALMISRCFLVNGRLYLALVGGNNLTEEHSNVKKFFGSFQIDAPAGQTSQGVPTPEGNPPAAGYGGPPPGMMAPGASPPGGFGGAPPGGMAPGAGAPGGYGGPPPGMMGPGGGPPGVTGGNLPGAPPPGMMPGAPGRPPFGGRPNR